MLLIKLSKDKHHGKTTEQFSSKHTKLNLLMASKQPLQNRLKRNGEQAASIISPT
jgi:hypothetical protein